MRNIVAKLAVSLLIGGLVLVASTPASAWEVGLDFITSGGWFFIQNPSYPVLPLAGPGGRADSRWHGGAQKAAHSGPRDPSDPPWGAPPPTTPGRDTTSPPAPSPR